ncbi:MAG: hypothetical protein ACRCZ2_04315 [Fusobacteriaceae bacterium]
MNIVLEMEEFDNLNKRIAELEENNRRLKIDNKWLEDKLSELAEKVSIKLGGL